MDKNCVNMMLRFVATEKCFRANWLEGLMLENEYVDELIKSLEDNEFELDAESEVVLKLVYLRCKTLRVRRLIN